MKRHIYVEEVFLKECSCEELLIRYLLGKDDLLKALIAELEKRKLNGEEVFKWAQEKEWLFIAD